ncbi:unnamed protein product [Triticum turgidum subsp. durum]|uniref:HVA22-like protein n=1 Tax=Triticum turgidum subsp. durum TaxID=4567 RepID=A0A9R0SY85_TRITD|nr:unnamed protein product [Triticum turgidum subsp. durum]
MLGEFLSRVLLLLFGYAMPAFECFKTVEARPNDAHMLRFWCQYWIIVAMVIAVESFISWMPMYGEIKLAFFVYLWYPKTKDIEQRLLHLRARSGQLLTFYIQNFADKGTAFFMDVLRSVVSDEPAPSVSERNKKSSGWSPFATKRRPPSPPPQESIFGGPADLDAAAVAQVIRASMAGAKPARRQYSGKY